MPIILPLQYDNHRGPDAVGQHKLTFTLDESISSDFNPMLIKKGTQFIVMMFEADSQEAIDFQNESPEDTKTRFRKMFEATIHDIAKLRGVEPDDFRGEFKEKLKKEGVIINSTKELSLEALGTQISRLKKYKYELEHKLR